MSSIEKWRWRALVLSGLNSLMLVWLWLPKPVGWRQLHLTLEVLAVVTIAYLLSLVTPFIAASTYHWTAWQVAEHWALAWFIYSGLAILGPIGLKMSSQGVLGGLVISFVGILCVDAPQNGVLGFRVPWTYRSPIIWRKTNVLGGWLFFASGVFCLIMSSWWPTAALPVVLISIILPGASAVVWYSYWLEHHPNHLTKG